ITTLLANGSKVVIADYYYIFNPHIRELFLGKADKDLSKCIVIVDEAHNLPKRLRELMTHRLSSYQVDRAISEAKKYKYSETANNLKAIKEILESMSPSVEQREKLVEKVDFMDAIARFASYDNLIDDLVFVADAVRETEKQSFVGSVAAFLDAWRGDDDGFVRIISQEMLRKPLITLSYRCLDPGLLSKEVVENAYSTIFMSGTLMPLEMYKDILSVEKAELEEYESPFPNENRLNLVIPETTTKYTSRNEAQFRRIAEIAAEVVNTVPGNSIVFFPSYSLRDSVDQYFMSKCKKTSFMERPRMSKADKREMLERFKSYHKQGAVMLGVVSGSFGEGIDLPGDFLKAVMVVGVPLQPPDLETRALIRFYDELFGRGMEYGYIFPAINRVMQNAGRVIRSEKDRGAVVLIDERYSWPFYRACFPPDNNFRSTKNYVRVLQEFFKE
ncbi:ATP-dependent DNA helicase, partial [Candidatus Woesearchaeota archaeon]|nr:ATP-dependent DNA helicase [Candidatus Woesearchaeota archaeon]